MARRNRHEEHQNHEAWAIPYGDLITLLLAFFVVMYAVSSINEGKYRVLSEALSEAFGGPPRSLKPIQIGRIEHAQSTDDSVFSKTSPSPALGGGMRALSPVTLPGQKPVQGTERGRGSADPMLSAEAEQRLRQIDSKIGAALAPLIQSGLVVVRRSVRALEVEIKADILFPSGSAHLADPALPILGDLSRILGPYPNPVRIEGHTDDRPIATYLFPSNWELSATRAATVVHLLAGKGLNPTRLSVVGYGEYRPVADNATAEGRNRNRRVVLVILAGDDSDELLSATQTGATAPGDGKTAGSPAPGKAIRAQAIAPADAEDAEPATLGDDVVPEDDDAVPEGEDAPVVESVEADASP